MTKQVEFNHDFEQGSSQDAKDIQKAWTDQVNAGMSIAAFYVTLPPPSLLQLPFDGSNVPKHRLKSSSAPSPFSSLFP